MQLNFHTPIKTNRELNYILQLLKNKGLIKSSIPYGTIIGDDFTLSELKKADPKDCGIKAINVGLYIKSLNTSITLIEIPKKINFKDFLEISLVMQEEWDNKMDFSKKKVVIEQFEKSLNVTLKKGEEWIKKVYTDLEKTLDKHPVVKVGNTIKVRLSKNFPIEQKTVRGFYFFPRDGKHKWGISTNTGVSMFDSLVKEQINLK